MRLFVTLAAGLAAVWVFGVLAMGEEACSSCSEWSLSGRIQEACHRALARQPYRPFDDHYPRFHPVPVSPVFPSLYESPSAAGRAAQGKDLHQRKIPAAVPYPIPATLPELVPTPQPNSGGALSPQRPPVPRQASRKAITGSWIFLPAAKPALQDESPLQRESEMAAQAGRLIR
jgi:hypothetical protein